MKCNSSALRLEDKEKLAKKKADVIVGIPSFNCAHTINYVVYQAAKGLTEYLSDLNGLIFVSDGRSTDGTREVVKAMRVPKAVELFVTSYTGIPGKGTAIRAILEGAKTLNAKGVALIDADLRSLKPEWIKLLLEPVIKGTDLVTPLYKRDRNDGTLTNHICYPLTLALYGKRIRQPIGGDFGLSKRMYGALMESDLWANPYVPKFGVDITMTHLALGEGYDIKEAMLGIKVHEAKDPLRLTSMFKQVVGATFTCMEKYERVWMRSQGLESVPLERGTATYGSPEPIRVDIPRLVATYRSEIERGLVLLRKLLPYDLIQRIEAFSKKATFAFPVDLWIKSLYATTASFKRVGRGGRDKLLDGLWVLWIGRVASFSMRVMDKSNEEAEAMIEGDARRFLKLKGYLRDIYKT